LKGGGNAAPLLLYGHVDVVTTQNQQWTHSPFEAKIADGYLWGRGTLDMKGGVAMMLAAILKAKTEGTSLPGDVIFTAVVDEEAGGDYGARFLVEEHPQLFQNVRYGLGEFGGFNINIGGTRVFPIMISEKQFCIMKATFRGSGGHGSTPVRNGAMAKLGRALQVLDTKKPPIHITLPVRVMFEAIAKVLPRASGKLIRQILNPAFTDLILKALGSRGALFAPLMRNTISPTMVQASDKFNVIPSQVELGLDGRLLPGLKPELMLAEVHQLLGEEAEIELIRSDPGPAEADMGLFDTLGGILMGFDPEAKPIPYVMMGATDARWFSKLGIQTYGFTPMVLPPDYNFMKAAHGADERIPVDAIDFGVQAIFMAMQRFS